MNATTDMVNVAKSRQDELRKAITVREDEIADFNAEIADLDKFVGFCDELKGRDPVPKSSSELAGGKVTSKAQFAAGGDVKDKAEVKDDKSKSGASRPTSIIAQKGSEDTLDF